MLMKPASLPIFEHDSATTRSVTRTPLGAGTACGQLNVSPLRVAGAIAKTIYADPETPLSVKAMLSFAAFVKVQWLSRPDKANNNLRLCARAMHSRYGLRDFSRASRIGEFGQGVCALFMQDHLKLPIVLDFGILCELLNVPYPEGGEVRPDFGGWNGGMYKLVESKSNFESTSTKTELREGLLQCDAGNLYLSAYSALKPSGSFAVLTNFQSDTGNLDSKLQFADPTDGGDLAPDEVNDMVVKYYYRCALEAFGMQTEPAIDFLRESTSDEVAEQQVLPGLSRDLVIVPTADLPPFIDLAWGWAIGYAFNYQMYIDNEVLKAIRRGSAREYQDAVNSFSEAAREVVASVQDAESPWTIWSDGLVMRLNVEVGYHRYSTQSL